jgi:BTB/POZ domain
MASGTQQVNVVFKTVQLNQHSDNLWIHIADRNCVYLDIHISSTREWLVFITGEYPDYGSSISEVFYSINSEPYKRMEQILEQNQMAAKFRTEEFVVGEFKNIWDDFPSTDFLQFTFAFVLIDTEPDFRLQRLDNRLTENLWAAAVNRQFTDIDLVVGNHTFPAHRAILAARSPVFASLLQNQANGNEEHRRIEITNVRLPIFYVLLRFIYTGKFQRVEDNRELYSAASLYGIETLKCLCERSI